MPQGFIPRAVERGGHTPEGPMPPATLRTTLPETPCMARMHTLDAAALASRRVASFLAPSPRPCALKNRHRGLCAALRGGMRYSSSRRTSGRGTS